MDNDNIQYYTYEDDENTEESVDLSFLLNDFEQCMKECEACGTTGEYHEACGVICMKECDPSNESVGSCSAQMTHYETNFTIKQLQLILEYYGLTKLKGLKKQDLISHIMVFETDPSNHETTTKRKMLWYYMNELKSDKILKRFILQF